MEEIGIAGSSTGPSAANAEANVIPPNLTRKSVPEALRPLNHFLQLGEDHLKIDHVISYWLYNYAAQKGLSLDKKSVESRTFIGNILNWLEAQRLKNRENEAIVHEMVAEAYIEKYALDLLKKAEELDRSGCYSKNTVKLFYTVGFICETLQCFGELSQDFFKRMNYSKWRASYIHKCLKTGEIPQAFQGEHEQESTTSEAVGIDMTIPPIPELHEFDEIIPGHGNVEGNTSSNNAVAHVQDVVKEFPDSAEGADKIREKYTASFEEIKLILEAQKYSKIAASCLDYKDIGTAKDLMQKALEILQKLDTK